MKPTYREGVKILSNIGNIEDSLQNFHNYYTKFRHVNQRCRIKNIPLIPTETITKNVKLQEFHLPSYESKLFDSPVKYQFM